MAEIISFSINLSKIDKTKIKVVDLKDGSKGNFIDVTVSINDEQDSYGNIAGLYLSQSKEERERKDKKVYLGNGKRVWASKPNAAPPSIIDEEKPDDLPF